MKHILIIISLCVASTLATAQDSFQQELFSVDLVLKYRAELDLSNKTADKIKDIYNSQSAEFNSLKWDLDGEMVALSAYLSPEQVDEAAAVEQLGTVMELENQLKRMKLAMLIQIKNKLSPSQQETLKRLRAENGDFPTGLITPISENPRMLLKVDGTRTSQDVLFIVINKDGEKRYNGSQPIDDIDPEDIESVEVLKGEKAIRKYGDDGKNGVVIIRMKK